MWDLLAEIIIAAGKGAAVVAAVLFVRSAVRDVWIAVTGKE